MSFISAPHTRSDTRRAAGARRTIAKATLQQGTADMVVGKGGKGVQVAGHLKELTTQQLAGKGGKGVRSNALRGKGGKGKDVGDDVHDEWDVVVNNVPVAIAAPVLVAPAINAVPVLSQDTLNGQWQGFSNTTHEVLSLALVAAWEKGFNKGAGKNNRPMPSQA